MSRDIVKIFRMGTAASSQVKTIDIDQNSDKYDRPRSSKAAKEKKELTRDTMFKQQQTELDLCRKELASAKEQARQYEAELKQLEYLLSEAESTNHDLNDRIQVLEDEIQSLHNDKLKTTPMQDYTESLKIKDQCIEKLERETTAVQQEISKLKSKYKKKIRSVHNQLAESKQETLLQVFELKDEISKMSEENTCLLERLERVKSAPSGRRSKGCDSDQSEDEDVGRTKVILELSQQVSQQDEKISNLERKLIEKDHLIQEIRIKQKASSSNSKSPQESPRSSSEVIYKHQVAHSANAAYSRTSHTIEQRSPSASLSRKADDLTDLKELATQINKMTKRKNKRKDNAFQDKDWRESSGISRDSGIVITESCDLGARTKPPRGMKASNHISSAKSISSLDSTISSDVDHIIEPAKNTSKHRHRKNHHVIEVSDLDDLLSETHCLQNGSFQSSGVHSVKVS